MALEGKRRRGRSRGRRGGRKGSWLMSLTKCERRQTKLFVLSFIRPDEVLTFIDLLMC